MTNTLCFQDQAKFDEDRENGVIGHLMQRPSCDMDGDYFPVKCIPGQK